MALRIRLEYHIVGTEAHRPEGEFGPLMIGEKNYPGVRIEVVDAREGLEAAYAGKGDAEQDDVG